MNSHARFEIDGHRVKRGESVDIKLKVSERYTGDPISLPIRVIRSRRAGPTVFVTAAIHGEELNGVGIIHDLMHGRQIELISGTLILVPVVNIFGFETQSRYMPDRRDLNRSFPGSESGSLTSRIASIIFQQIVRQSDYGIDLHTAAAQRTNFPNIRGDLTQLPVRRIAKAFGCELMLNGKGPEGSFRREAVKAGCAVVTLEAGEPWKIEPAVLEVGVRGVTNVLRYLRMTEGAIVAPKYQARVDKSTWVRAEVGGILRFHVTPGQFIERSQAIATNASVFGEAQNQLVSPVEGVVLGMTTLPTVKPGEPVCHIAIPGRSLRQLRRDLESSGRNSLYRRLRRDLATNITLSENEAEIASDARAEQE